MSWSYGPDRSGRIDALACIAGTVPQRDMFEPTDEQWDHGLALKFNSARRLPISPGRRSRVSHGPVAITAGTSAYAPKASLAAVGAINVAILAVAKAFADRGHQGRRAGQHDPAGISHHGPAMLHAPRLCLGSRAGTRRGDRAIRGRGRESPGAGDPMILRAGKPMGHGHGDPHRWRRNEGPLRSPNSGTTIWVDRRFRWASRCASEPSRPGRSPFVRR